MRKLILILAIGLLSLGSSLAATLSANAIYAVSEEDLQMATHLAVHKDYAGLEEMDRQGKINVFKAPLEVTVYKRNFLTTAFTFPGKTTVLYTASELVKD